MTFEDRLRGSFEQMISYREAIGYATATYRCSVPPFINFCVKQYPDAESITQEMVDGWLSSYPYSSNGRAVFVSLLREYTKYLHFLGCDDFIRMTITPRGGLFIILSFLRTANWEACFIRSTDIPAPQAEKGTFPKSSFCVFAIPVLLRDAPPGATGASLQGRGSGYGRCIYPAVKTS